MWKIWMRCYENYWRVYFQDFTQLLLAWIHSSTYQLYRHPSLFWKLGVEYKPKCHILTTGSRVCIPSWRSHQRRGVNSTRVGDKEPLLYRRSWCVTEVQRWWCPASSQKHSKTQYQNLKIETKYILKLFALYIYSIECDYYFLSVLSLNRIQNAGKYTITKYEVNMWIWSLFHIASNSPMSNSAEWCIV